MRHAGGCWRVTGGCGEAVWRLWEGYLEDMGRLHGGVGRLSSGCKEAV